MQLPWKYSGSGDFTLLKSNSGHKPQYVIDFLSV
ncbi:hypothetical protein gpAD87_14070 [Paenibacillus sp. AD87]|nr:hypothetical protein gpAD87_14070 [Paenibacillus sp. AD87]